MHVLGHPEGSFYQEFKNTCLDGFDYVTYQTVKYRLGEHFQLAFNTTLARFPEAEERKDESKIGLVVTHWVAEGTFGLLHGETDAARSLASFAFFIQDVYSVLILIKGTAKFCTS